METKTTQSADSTIVIVATGAESTGKTDLCRYLSTLFGIPWVPELARGYIEQLNRPYTYNDVINIARLQLSEYKAVTNAGHKAVLFDTDLIITKVWLDVVYHQCPQWIIDAIASWPTNMHLLCETDLPWVADNVRENGGPMREVLSQTYKKELERFGLPYVIIRGTGDNRRQCATDVVGRIINV